MVFSATFNNISVVSWRKPEYPEKTTDLSQVWQTLLHNNNTNLTKKWGMNSDIPEE